MGDSTTASNLYYFLGGALLPTVAYILFNKKDERTAEKAGGNVNDDSSDDEFEPINDSSDSKNWGLMDAPYKMVLCVNTSLGMGKGKIAAQCCHAAVGCYKRASKQCPAGLRAWETTGCAKIAVKCPSEDEMMNEILIKAMQAGTIIYFNNVSFLIKTYFYFFFHMIY